MQPNSTCSELRLAELGKVVAKFCSKFLQQQVLKNEEYAAGDIGTSVQKAFFRLLDFITKEFFLSPSRRVEVTTKVHAYDLIPCIPHKMDEMMRGQRGWRELEALGDKINKFTGMIEGLIWSPRCGGSDEQPDDWAFREGPHSDFSGPTCGCTACVAYSLSRDHKPYLEVEKERILKGGGFIHAGRVNGCLNLARAIVKLWLSASGFPHEK
ncbi:hypothetical protein DKX38_022293 [Salix brachista]|uniref:PPM-type phosphatase domain-containing protein n=1 Tax=Salix brachista TaxID=2182728 RepID=A0A5N5K2F5_9ROSI|nr:hypothetical protein DKX38_022293 [Salix brachista]